MAAPKPVLLEPNCVYHIFAHAVHANDFFYDEENKRFFLEKWKYFSKGFFKTYAYCLLSNHFHFAVQVEKTETLIETIQTQRNLRLISKLDASLELASSLEIITTSDLPKIISKQINNFLSSYTQSLNKQRKRKGTLVRERFGRLKVDNRAYLKDMICYIHHNPIHHFGVENYSEWKYSSYNSYAFELENEIVEKENILKLFGGLEEFKAYHKIFKENKQFTDIENAVLDERNNCSK
jgi:REP element-mobilizing transposase RayT